MVYIVDGKELNEEEYAQLESRRQARRDEESAACRQAEQRDRKEAADLVRQLDQAYAAYKEFMAGRPQLTAELGGRRAADPFLYQRLRHNLKRADAAPRCTHVKADGLCCGSPRMKTGAYCYAHQRMMDSHPPKLLLPAMTDPYSIQRGFMEVARALIDGRISEKAATALLYGLQTAAVNLGRLTFHKSSAGKRTVSHE